MARKLRNRKALELSICIDIGSLCLARQPAGWNRCGKANRAVGLRHVRGTCVFAETTLRARVGATTGLVAIEHRDASGSRIEQWVELATISMPRGGQRWLFVCPVTGGRARKLHRHPGSRQFCSRQGLPEPVSYQCQRDSGAKRVMRQIWELRRRMGTKGSLFEAFDKPADMADAEFTRHAQRYLELADRLDFTNRGLKLKRAGRPPQAEVVAERVRVPSVGNTDFPVAPTVA